MASFSTRGKTILTKYRPQIPDKWKGGRLEKIGGFFMNIVKDYKSAVMDMVQDMQQAPKKATFYITLLASGAILAKTNPSETSYHVALSDCHHELLLLGDPIRNRCTDSHIQCMQGMATDGRLRYTNCGLFSLMWVAGYNAEVYKFEAQCKLVKPRWVEFHKQVVDVGVLGHWHRLRKAMIDYDVNIDEWDEEGNKVQKESSPGARQAMMASP